MTSTQLHPGTVIHGTHNDYRIERVLGQGSFGITYVANLSVHTVPGPAFGLLYVGVKATDLSGYTYYYKWIGSNFELIAKYDKKEREEREQFT